MRMKNLYLLIAGTVALVLASTACQTAQRPAALLPAGHASAPALIAAAAPQPQPAPEAKPTAPPAPAVPKPDPAAELIAQVEKEYQAGQENYKAGNTEAAQANFDHAFDLLLKSPLDIRSNPLLQQEFDHLVAGMDELEHASPASADSATEQKAEPAPIDETNEITVPVDPNINAKAAAEVKATPSDLPLMLTDPVASYITYFSTRGRGTLEHALAR